MLGLDLLKEVPGLLEEIKALPLRLDEERFRFWLQQDYPFVEALYRYQVGLLLEAPQAHRAPLVQALMATVEELDWLLLQGPALPPRSTRCGRATSPCWRRWAGFPTPTGWSSSTS